MGGTTALADDGTLTVTLSCRVKPPVCIPRDTLRQAFAATVGSAADAQTLARVRIVTRPGDCQCPP